MKKEELLNRTKKELLALASEKGMRLSARLRKGELVDRILSLARSRNRSPAKKAAGKVQPRSPQVRPVESAARKRRAPPPIEKTSLESSLIPSEALLRISEEISRDFPRSFEKTEIVLLSIDPFHAHAFWHVRPEEEESARKAFGPGGDQARLLLRFYDVTLLDFDGSNAHSWFDVSVHSLQSNTYIDFWESGRSYLVEIGLQAQDGRFHTLARSSHIELPPHGPSDNFDRTGLVVDTQLNIICEVADVTRAEWLDEICPEPRLEMEAGASDDLVRSFYRQLTSRNLTGPFRPRPMRAVPDPLLDAAAGGERPEDAQRTTPDGKPSLQTVGGSEASDTSPREGDRSGPNDDRSSRRESFAGPYSEIAPDPPLPRLPTESSFGIYRSRRKRSGASSWIHAEGSESSRVTSPGARGEGDGRLEQVFILPPPPSNETASATAFSAVLVVRGKAAPGSRLTLFGQSVLVRPDGTFSVRAELPEGTMVVPLPRHGERPETPDSGGEPE